MSKEVYSRNAQIMNNSLDVMGIHTDERKIFKLPTRFFFVVCILCSGTFSTGMYAVLHASQVDEAIKVAAYFGGSFLQSICVPYLWSRRYSMQTFITSIKNNVYTYSDECEIPVQYTWMLRKKYSLNILISVVVFISFGFVVGSMSPVYGFYMTGTISSVYPSWFPWSQTTTLGFAITIAAQLITCLVLCSCYFSIQFILVFSVIEFLRQHKKLSSAIATITSRTDKYVAQQIVPANETSQLENLLKNMHFINYKTSSFQLLDRVKYNKAFEKKSIECIKHYQKLYALFDVIRPWFIFFFTTELVISVITFSLIFYNTLNQKSNSEMFLTITGSAFVAISNLFSRCFFGQIFEEMNEQITEAIFYDSNWYNQTIENRKLLFILHILAQKSLKINAFGIFNASHSTFKEIIKKSYSYLSVLNQSMKH